MRLLFCLIFFYSVNAFAQKWTLTMDTMLASLAVEELFHGQVLVAEKGKIQFHQAYGYDENGAEINRETPLAIASVSKAFTAMSILMLQEKGLLELDNKLTDYFPELPYKEISLKHLMNMTSGLPRFQSVMEKYGEPQKIYSTKQIIELVATYKPEAISPGQEFAYNGDNYVLLAAIVEKVSGDPFAAFVHQNIFEPLQMRNSYFYKLDQHGQQLPISVDTGPALGAGHIHSTAYDLFLFEEALFNNKLVAPEIIDQAFEFTRLNDGKPSNYGFAWRLHKNDESDEAYIVGDGENTRASMQYDRKTNKTLIYIHNISGSQWHGVYTAVRNIWESKPFEIPKKRSIYPIDTRLYRKYTGQYLSEAFGLLHITKENNKLYLRPDPIPGKEELIPSSRTTFYFAEQALEWEFYLDKNGKVLGLGLKGKPETMGPKQ